MYPRGPERGILQIERRGTSAIYLFHIRHRLDVIVFRGAFFLSWSRVFDVISEQKKKKKKKKNQYYRQNETYDADE